MPISRIETNVARVANDSVYGHGSDGNVVITTNTSITSDMYYNNLTVNSGVLLNSNGFRIFVKNTLTLNGYIGIGSVSGATVSAAASAVSHGTTSGHTTGAITYRAGGSGGNDVSSVALPSFLYKSVNAMSGGIFMDPASGMVPIRGGGFGGAGSAGATLAALTNSDTWPGKTGATGTAGSATGSVNSVANPYKDTVSVPGGKGATAASGNVTGWTDGVPGAAGTGGLGGGVVCIVAKTVVGSGMIISVGSTGTAGTAGTTGTTGSQGANGAAASNLAYHVAPVIAHVAPVANHVAPTANHVAPTHNPGHHHGYARFADHHLHTVNPPAHGGGSHHHSHQPAVYYAGGFKVPASHTAAFNYNDVHNPNHTHPTNHYHHTGSAHHPHSNDGHGVLTHTHNWPSVIHAAAKTNHADQHSHPATTGHFEGRVYHQHAGGHDGHIHAGQGIPAHTHTHANGHDLGNGTQYGGQGNGMWISGGHHHGPHHYSNGYFTAARHSHHANPNTHTANPNTHTAQPNSSTAQPDGHWTGGAGGVNDGVNYGKAAPARTAPSGTNGGPGGGGAILVVTDAIVGTITYNTTSGNLVSAGGTPATSGSAYILINS